MAYFKLRTFGGIAPQLSPRLVTDSVAQTAQNVMLESGRLVPITNNTTTTALNTVGQNSIYKYTTGGSDYWLEWSDEGVDVVPGPIAGDTTNRLYWTGQGGTTGFPRMSKNSLITTGGSPYPNASYRLGLPIPTNTAATSVSGTDDGTQTKYSTSYVYTYVTEYGEEGPPSAASTVFDKVDGQTVTVSSMDTSVGTGAGRTNTNVTHKRIYRSNTGSNTTAFQFVKQVTLATASTTDNANNSALAELIPSTYWIGPPNEVTADYPDGPMKGLVAMPGGVMAGFTGKRICFSEPYLPHAWPVAYRITLEENIIGMEMAGPGLVVTTEGTPYLIVGTDPQSMSTVRIEAAQACLSKTSMVDMGPYVLYAGADGLVAAAGTDVQVLTENLISPAQWRADYYPSSLRGFLWEGRYVGLYTSGSNYGGFIFDPRSGKNELTTLTQTSSTDVTGGFTDPDDNELYLIVDTSGSAAEIQKFQGGSTNQTFNWKSKEFVPERPAAMGFFKVNAETYPVVVKLYGDGALIYHATIASSGSVFTVTGTSPSFSTTTIQEPIVRLPSGVYNDYSMEIQAATVVNEVCIAESMDEIRGI